MNKIIRFILSLIFILLGILISDLNIIFYIISFIICGYDILFKALKNIIHGEIFDENFLMLIASIGAFFVGEYLEGIAVIILYQIGEYLQDVALGKSKKSIVELMDLRPDKVHLLSSSNVSDVELDKVNIDDVIVCYAGEKIGLDGIIIKGESSLDMKNLTGESIPKDVITGDEVLSGSLNLISPLYIKVTKNKNDSTASKIIELIEDATINKSNQEKFITKFAKIYTPIVCLFALIIAFIVPLFLGFDKYFNIYLYRALNFLIISCPCALVLSIPLSYFAGIGRCAKDNILFKGSNYLENINKVKTVIFDKTGTLTKGNFEIVKINPNNIKEEELLFYACLVEKNSNHPIALSIKKMINVDIDITVKEEKGLGLIGYYNDQKILLGNEQLMKRENINYILEEEVGTIIYLSLDSKFLGSIVIRDTIKDTTYSAIKKLKEQNIDIFMLTGDNQKIAKMVASKLEIDNFYSDLLPNNKVEIIKDIINKKKNSNELVCFVGDGINDAPSLAISDIGISMGKIGSDAAIEASDIVIMKDDLNKINDAIIISRKTNKKVKENIVFSITVKFLVLILSLFGFMNMWIAVISDVGVCIIAILNAIRLLKEKI